MSRSLRRQLREQARELERQDAARSALLAELAHELRTPLASLRGYLETLLQKDARLTAEERRRFLEIAARQSEELGERLAELLELARLGSRDFRLQPEPVQLAELLQDLVLERRAAAPGVAATVELFERPPPVLADIALIERALRRLLDDGLRAARPAGRLTLRLARRDGQVSVVLACSAPCADAGGGMARRILELHGTALSAECTAQAGTRLSFSLPVA